MWLPLLAARRGTGGVRLPDVEHAALLWPVESSGWQMRDEGGRGSHRRRSKRTRKRCVVKLCRWLTLGAYESMLCRHKMSKLRHSFMTAYECGFSHFDMCVFLRLTELIGIWNSLSCNKYSLTAQIGVTLR